jgi:hypothetical protein
MRCHVDVGVLAAEQCCGLSLPVVNGRFSRCGDCAPATLADETKRVTRQFVKLEADRSFRIASHVSRMKSLEAIRAVAHLSDPTRHAGQSAPYVHLDLAPMLPYFCIQSAPHPPDILIHSIVGTA